MTYQLPNESQRYDRYTARMQFLGRFLRGIRRHPLLTTGILLVLIFGILALLLSMGSISGSMDCPDFHYGSVPQWDIKAFLSPIQYQHAQDDGLWQEGLPTRPGQYRLRAVSRNGFGQQRSTEAVTVQVLPRPMEVQIPSGSFVYGDFDPRNPNVKFTNLASGDYVSAVSNFEEITSGNYKVTLETITIFNPSGEDVTDCYTISATEGRFTMTHRPITLRGKNAQKLYDGQPWNQAQVTLTKGSLAQGDTLQVQFDAAPAYVGTHRLMPKCTVVNAYGQDVTNQYNIQVFPATLTVQPLPIWIATPDAEKVYDGTPLTKPEWSLDEGDVIPGHTLVTAVTGSQTNAGQSPNTMHIQILDAQGGDVTTNYEVFLSTGTLTVKPRSIAIQSEDAQKTYDGEPLTCHRYSPAEDVLPGHSIESAAFTGSQTEVGSSANTFTVQIVDEHGIAVTGNYDIRYLYGTLTVVERQDGSQGGGSQESTGTGSDATEPEPQAAKLTIRAISATKVYDGKGFYAFDLSGYDILSGQLRPGHRLEVECSIDQDPVTPGQYRNVITRCRVYDENGKDVTKKQYNIHTIAGTLTILHRTITVTLGSATKVYDGNVLTCGEYWISEGSLLPSHQLELTTDASLRDVGQVENNASTLRILSDGKDVTDCYKITLIPGKLEITEVKIR